MRTRRRNGGSMLAVAIGLGLVAAGVPAVPATADGAVAPPTLTKAGYVLSNGNGGTLDLEAADAGPDSRARVPGDGPVVVSLGDSYISGEAGRWAGNSDRPAWAEYSDALGPNAYADLNGSEALPQCHRSRSAEINIPGNGVASVNLACSGATTSTAADEQPFKPGVDFADTRLSGGAHAMGQALLLQNLAASNPGRVTMVVLSVGGNDFNFGSIVATCLEQYLSAGTPCSRLDTVLANFTPANIEAKKAAILGAITNVQTAMTNAGYGPTDWSLLVQTYPSPVATSATIRYRQGYQRQFTGGCGLYDTDLDWANYGALKTINDTVMAAARAARVPGAADVEILDLSDALSGHRLCEVNTNIVGPLAWYPIYGYVWSVVRNWQVDRAVDLSEWTAQIRVGTKLHADAARPYELQESLHPNYWGQKAIGACVIQAWNGGDGVRGGACQYGDTGLVDGRPVMRLIRWIDWDSGQPLPHPDRGLAGAPSAVRGLAVRARADGVARVSWQRPKDGPALGYFVRLRAEGKAWGGWVAAGSSRTTLLSVLRPGRAYQVQVLAHNNVGSGPSRADRFRAPQRG